MAKNDAGYTVPDGVTVDVIMYNEFGDIMMIRRNKAPYADMLALPGGHIDEGEDVMSAAIREVKEETNIELTDLHLLGVYSSKHRDPRGWYISTVYYSYVPSYIMLDAKEGDDAGAIVGLDHTLIRFPILAFNHAKIINDFRKAYHGNKFLR